MVEVRHFTDGSGIFGSPPGKILSLISDQTFANLWLGWLAHVPPRFGDLHLSCFWPRLFEPEPSRPASILTGYFAYGDWDTICQSGYPGGNSNPHLPRIVE